MECECCGSCSDILGRGINMKRAAFVIHLANGTCCIPE